MTPPADTFDVSTEACLALADRLGLGERVTLSDADARRLAARATADCALARAAILGAAGFVSDALALRRNAWRLVASRARAIELTFHGSSQDEDFRRAIADADAARDRGAWLAAERLYARAIAPYPLHHGYRAQLAHMLKEQGHFLRAEIAYRDALALGAPPDDVLQHLRFVCTRQGRTLETPARAAATGRAMDQAPASFDVETLAWLFWHDAGVSDEDHAMLLRTCASCEEVALHMAADRRFARRNRAFSALLKARG